MTRWDNIEILRTIGRLQERYGGAPTSEDGRQIMEEVAGSQVIEESRWRGFVQELDIAVEGRLITFRVDSQSNADSLKRSYPYQYLQVIRGFALTVAGQDRARGRVMTQEPPDPGLDDGRPISGLILERVAEAIDEEYTAKQTATFLAESCASMLSVPMPVGSVREVLGCLDELGSEGRRALRSFLGRWLDDRLDSGPDEKLRTSLTDKLARQGWYVVDGDLVIGERAAGKRVPSPVLRGARLAALHPRIGEVASPYVNSDHLASAVLEAVKAVNERVRELTNITDDGYSLMNKAFSDKQPALLLGDLSDETGRNIQSGYRFIFAGVQQAIRNSAAHKPLPDLDVDEAFELLALFSLLMRRLDEAKATGQTPQGTGARSRDA